MTGRIAKYLTQPGPLWDTELTPQLVTAKLRDMSKPNSGDYTLTFCITHNDEIKEISYAVPGTGGIHIVEPSETLKKFYEKHGLEVIPINDPIRITLKIQNALGMLDKAGSVSTFIKQIVRSVQILRANDPETDTSYSHPDIPFSIFFSVCQQGSPISDLRVAESILHEAMHLELTLIENYCPLIEPGTKYCFYSPWRDEERPIRGVLHGMFVFRAIADFYFQLTQLHFDPEIAKFLHHRISTISKEIEMLQDFGKTPGLTANGKILVEKLLSVNQTKP